MIAVMAKAQTLYEHYVSRGEQFTQCESEERKQLARDCGIENYSCTEEQNDELLRCLEGNIQGGEAVDIPFLQPLFGVYPPFLRDIMADRLLNPIFGGTGEGAPFRPAEFKSNLGEAKTEGHSDTTLVVTSLLTKDGNTLSAAILGDLIVLSINPGASNSEIVTCTDLTVATKTFSGCTFGYRFDRNATQASNIEAHAPGEPVIISNTDNYLVNQYPTLDGGNLFTGSTTFATTTESVGRLYFGTSTDVYIWWNKSTGQFGFATSTSGELAWSSDGTTFNSIVPLTLASGELKLNTSTYAFNLTDSNTNLNIATGTISSGTASGTALDDLFNTRFNATTTKNLVLTLSDGFQSNASSTILTGDRFLINGNSTTTGDVQIDGNSTTTGAIHFTELIDSNNVSVTSIIPQFAGQAIDTVTCNPGVSAYLACFQTKELGFQPDEVRLQLFMNCTGDTSIDGSSSFQYIRTTSTPFGVGWTPSSASESNSNTNDGGICNWTGASASSTIDITTTGFIIKFGASEGATFAGQAVMSGRFQAIKY